MSTFQHLQGMLEAGSTKNSTHFHTSLLKLQCKVPYFLAQIAIVKYTFPCSITHFLAQIAIVEHLPTDLETPPRGVLRFELPDSSKKPLERSLVMISAAAFASAARRSCNHEMGVQIIFR